MKNRVTDPNYFDAKFLRYVSDFFKSQKVNSVGNLIKKLCLQKTKLVLKMTQFVSKTTNLVLKMTKLVYNSLIVSYFN